MSLTHSIVPCLTTAKSGPLHHIESVILRQVAAIETWFREHWHTNSPPITSSVDLRHAGYKLAPVDTNLFPAGFNNLNPDFFPLCIQAVQSVLGKYQGDCSKILILPEMHTRNQFYLQSLRVLRDILSQAGFIVRVGTLDMAQTDAAKFHLSDGETILLEPLVRRDEHIGVADFDPCLVILNNDLSKGVPDILKGLKQPIQPTTQLGWTSRLKSSHFQFYDGVANEFAEVIGLDSWLINPMFSTVEKVDFMSQTGLQCLADSVDLLLTKIRDQYKKYDIKEKPFAVVKADNGTYGMSVMMVQDGAELLSLNRKQRTRMNASKGSQKVSRVIIQEGVYSFETMPDDNAVAEPVVYMIGEHVVGGFYRVHKGRGVNENLNAPGMHFKPLAFAEACNLPCAARGVVDCSNRFYVYGVIARLAALAAAREVAAIGEKP